MGSPDGLWASVSLAVTTASKYSRSPTARNAMAVVSALFEVTMARRRWAARRRPSAASIPS